MKKNICNDYGDNPRCLKEADDSYTMRFDEIGEPPIYWCAFCGPIAQAIEKAITAAMQTRGPEFTEAFGQAIKEANALKVKH